MASSTSAAVAQSVAPTHAWAEFFDFDKAFSAENAAQLAHELKIFYPRMSSLNVDVIQAVHEALRERVPDGENDDKDVPLGARLHKARAGLGFFLAQCHDKIALSIARRETVREVVTSELEATDNFVMSLPGEEGSAANTDEEQLSDLLKDIKLVITEMNQANDQVVQAVADKHANGVVLHPGSDAIRDMAIKIKRAKGDPAEIESLLDQVIAPDTLANVVALRDFYKKESDKIVDMIDSFVQVVLSQPQGAEHDAT